MYVIESLSSASITFNSCPAASYLFSVILSSASVIFQSRSRSSYSYPVVVPSTFVICADFNPEKTKGVYVHYDDSASGNSLIGLPGQEMKVFNRGEWMIRAVVQQSGSKSMQLDKPKSGNKQSPLGKWESVDYVRKVEDFKPGEKSWQGELFLKGIEFSRGGKTSNPMMPKWRKGWILHGDGRTKAKYIIKEIDGTTYLFLPWLSGDVTNRG